MLEVSTLLQRPELEKTSEVGGGASAPEDRSAGRLKTDSPPPASVNDRSVLGGRVPSSNGNNELEGPPNGFRLFCCYHLGITPDDGYQKPGLDSTARHYSISHEEVRRLLSEHRLDLETMKRIEFDLEGAKLDVRLAPKGVSRIAIARDQYDD